MSEFLLITGLSGAGSSTAANALEDLGWFVIDNLPTSLIGKVAELAQAPGATNDRVALVVRQPQLDELHDAVTALRQSADRVRLLFLDCRFLPNPNWVEELRPRTGHDAEVRDYVLGFPQTGAFLERLDHLLDLLLPAYVDEGKAYLTVALGCTGGRHRSVVISEEVAARPRKRE